MVVWIIGLSGSGKTTLAQKVMSEIKDNINNTILLDGDIIREIFDNDLGFSLNDRLVNAKRLCKLGKFLSDNGFYVICSILSIFPETRKWNRDHVSRYYEVYIDSPIEDLILRDSKGIYKKFQKGEIKNVVGMDIKFPIPENPDLTINNISTKEKLLSYSKEIVRALKGN